MKSQPLLFDTPKDAPSRKERLHAFMATHEILTHCRVGDWKTNDREDAKWIALHVPTCRESSYCKDTSSVFAIMADICRLLDDANLIGYGQTEAEAVESICNRVEIEFQL